MTCSAAKNDAPVDMLGKKFYLWSGMEQLLLTAYNLFAN